MNQPKKSMDRRQLIQGGMVAGTAAFVGSCRMQENSSKTSENSTFGTAVDTVSQKIVDELMDYMSTLKTIDTHEHLIVENQRLKMEVDVLTLVSQYAYVDMVSAGYGLPEGESWFSYNYPQDTKVPLEERWKILWPHLQNIKMGSYYRAAKITLRDIYGIDDLNERTYKEASKKIQAANKPGLYRDILRKRCNIDKCLMQNRLIQGQEPPDIFIPVYTGTHGAYSFWSQDYIRELEKRNDTSIKELDLYLELMVKDMQWARDHGAVGCKIFIEPQGALDMQTAKTDFRQFLDGDAPSQTLKNTVLDVILHRAEQWDWPVAVHTGVWGDYRGYDPKPVMDLVREHPSLRFDVYHLGMPYVRDCIFIAKNFPNVYLNLCWAYIVSQDITEQSIQEILDTVPVNKVFAFGGDYSWAVENVYGHLMMARDTLAQAFSQRIVKGRIAMDEAKYVLQRWFVENPRSFYCLRA